MTAQTVFLTSCMMFHSHQSIAIRFIFINKLGGGGAGGTVRVQSTQLSLCHCQSSEIMNTEWWSSWSNQCTHSNNTMTPDAQTDDLDCKAEIAFSHVQLHEELLAVALAQWLRTIHKTLLRNAAGQSPSSSKPFSWLGVPNHHSTAVQLFLQFLSLNSAGSSSRKGWFKCILQQSTGSVFCLFVF